MSPQVFVDSAGWIGLLHKGDDLHDRAVAEYSRLVDYGYLFVTTSLILVEVASAFAAPNHRHLAVELERRYHETAIGELVWIDRETNKRAWDLYRNRPDKGWSLVDCASFVVMEDLAISEVLTADHHFEQAGFHNLL